MANPIEIPTPAPFNTKVFELRYKQNISSTEGGYIQTISRGAPVWYAEYTTPPLKALREQAFQAFIDKLEGSKNTFMGFDPKRTKPYAYLNGSSFGTPTITGSTPASNLLAMGGWSVGAIITPGDYISYQIGNRWYLHRVVTAAVANGSGVASVEVRPKPPVISSTVTARMNRAGCEMKLIGAPDVKDSLSDGIVYSLKAVQFAERG